MQNDIVALRKSLSFPIDGAVWGFRHKLISSRILGHCETFQIDPIQFVDSRDRCALVFHYSLPPLLFFFISVLGNNLLDLRILMARKACSAGNRCEQIGGKIRICHRQGWPTLSTNKETELKSRSSLVLNHHHCLLVWHASLRKFANYL